MLTPTFNKLTHTLHWAYYAAKYPKTFRDFCQWFEEKYPKKFRPIGLKGYLTARICEYCLEKGYLLELKEDCGLFWNIFVNGKSPNLTPILQACIISLMWRRLKPESDLLWIGSDGRLPAHHFLYHGHT
jgi:hypothetical protein